MVVCTKKSSRLFTNFLLAHLATRAVPHLEAGINRISHKVTRHADDELWPLKKLSPHSPNPKPTIAYSFSRKNSFLSLCFEFLRFHDSTYMKRPLSKTPRTIALLYTRTLHTFTLYTRMLYLLRYVIALHI